MHIKPEMIFGLTEEHLTPIPGHDGHQYHIEISQDWSDLVSRAKEKGIELKAISSFRSFSAQRNIWNLKAKGMRPLLDDKEQPISYDQFDLNNEDDQYKLILTILRWSALPGLSRHHWGTELDIVDANALKDNPDYKVQLIPSEYSKDGIFEKLGEFLEYNLEQTEFNRPYAVDLGGVAPEPWHLSHRKISQHFINHLNKERYLELLKSEGQDIELSSSITFHLDEIMERFVFNLPHNL